jgi:hypothetical protein
VGELVNVTFIATLVEPMLVFGNDRAVGERVTGATPFPVRFTTCVFGEALSTMVIAPAIEPTVVGAKLTLMVQLALGARLAPHVFVLGNSPLAEIPVIVSVLEVLVFFRVTV